MYDMYGYKLLCVIRSVKTNCVVNIIPILYRHCVTIAIGTLKHISLKLVNPYVLDYSSILEIFFIKTLMCPIL